MRHRIFTVLFLIIDIILIMLFVPSLRSLSVMTIYSAMEKQDSVFKQADIEIRMPGGLYTREKDWSPLVMLFNADGFPLSTGHNADLSILYNFGAFNYERRCSSLYDEKSNYHGAFYGAYALKPYRDNPFGYDINGVIKTDEMADIFRYDMEVLVLKSLGCDHPNFKYEITDTSTETMFDLEFDVIDAKIITNSPLHRCTNFYQSYIQYGSPRVFNSKKDFKKLQTYGRIYATHLNDKNITLCFYVIAPDQTTIDTTVKTFIKNTTLKIH